MVQQQALKNIIESVQEIDFRLKEMEKLEKEINDLLNIVIAIEL